MAIPAAEALAQRAGSATTGPRREGVAVATIVSLVSASQHGSGCVAALGHERYLATEDFDDDGVVN